MTNYREILRLHSLGLNKTEIAASLHYARNTVAATLQRAGNCGLQWPLPDEMSDRQLAERLFPSAPGKPAYKMPDYAYVYKEMQKSGVTLNLLWLEYCDQCKASGEIPYQSTQFNKYYSDYLHKANATMHLNHKPGEIMQVDWAGDTASVIDTDTGRVIPAYVCVAILPYSGYSYVEAFFSMNQECWTAAHVNAYRYFGGVTRMIQCDNLKTGVEKHGKDEVVLNKSYQELAEHYATAIVPTRVRAPKDKAAVEGTVGIISTYILAALRNRQFLSLPELNEAIWERLKAFNNKPFQKKNGSRASLFAEEKPFLRPLPPYPFELATWKKATVGPNYHISVERMNYSVPFEYIRQKVDVRLTSLKSGRTSSSAPPIVPIRISAADIISVPLYWNKSSGSTFRRSYRWSLAMRRTSVPKWSKSSVCRVRNRCGCIKSGWHRRRSELESSTAFSSAFTRTM